MALYVMLDFYIFHPQWLRQDFRLKDLPSCVVFVLCIPAILHFLILIWVFYPEYLRTLFPEAYKDEEG